MMCLKLKSYQNKILSVLAIRSVRQTNVENPSVLLVFLISLYCGQKGKTPPNIMKGDAIKARKLTKVISAAGKASSNCCKNSNMVPLVVFL